MKPYYQDEWVTIYHGDCREILPELPKVDLVLTDPPYSNDFLKFDYATGRTHQGGLGGIKHRYIPEALSSKPTKGVLDMLRGISRNQIIFGGNYFAEDLPNSSCWLVWDKDTHGNFADAELCWTSFGEAVRLYKFRWSGMLQENMKDKDYRWHPTQKPTGLVLEILADYSKINDLILDPFLGSGTTAYCAKKLNRRCIGIEIEEKYCEIAAKRCAQSVMRLEI